MARLIDELGRLPGIGPKTAQRLAFHLLRGGPQRASELGHSIVGLHQSVGYCSVCFNIADAELCRVCANPRRDRSMVCVVESASDVLAIERSAEYQGLYHVLQGVISPMDGIGPDELRIRELLLRVSAADVKEVIVATNADVEGEATASYLAGLLQSQPQVKVTRPAHGLPVGGDLEYADDLTLARALAGRRNL